MATGLSPMWVKRVAPIDDDFVPYVPTNQYQYNPNLVPTYPQPQPYQYDTPRTTRAVAVGFQGAKSKQSRHGGTVTEGPYYANKLPISMSMPTGPDIPYREYKYKSYEDMNKVSKSRNKYHDKNTNQFAEKIPISMGLPLGPDIRHREYKYKPYDKPYEEVKFKQYITPYREYEYKEYGAEKATRPKKRVAKPIVAAKTSKSSKKVQIKDSAPVVYSSGNREVDSAPVVYNSGNREVDATTAVTMATMGTNYDEDSLRRQYSNDLRRSMEHNPTGARESIRRTYGFSHGVDF